MQPAPNVAPLVQVRRPLGPQSALVQAVLDALESGRRGGTPM